VAGAVFAVVVWTVWLFVRVAIDVARLKASGAGVGSASVMIDSMTCSSLRPSALPPAGTGASGARDGDRFKTCAQDRWNPEEIRTERLPR
jgi:hypothetical protein